MPRASFLHPFMPPPSMAQILLRVPSVACGNTWPVLSAEAPRHLADQQILPMQEPRQSKAAFSLSSRPARECTSRPGPAAACLPSSVGAACIIRCLGAVLSHPPFSARGGLLRSGRGRITRRSSRPRCKHRHAPPRGPLRSPTRRPLARSGGDIKHHSAFPGPRTHLGHTCPAI